MVSESGLDFNIWFRYMFCAAIFFWTKCKHRRQTIVSFWFKSCMKSNTSTIWNNNFVQACTLGLEITSAIVHWVKKMEGYGWVELKHSSPTAQAARLPFSPACSLPCTYLPGWVWITGAANRLPFVRKKYAMTGIVCHIALYAQFH